MQKTQHQIAITSLKFDIQEQLSWAIRSKVGALT